MPGEKLKKIRTIVADDHALVREGIVKILSLEPDILVVGEAEDGEQAVDLAVKMDVDIILMDINMPKINGIEATRIIKGKKPEVNIIALTIHEQEDYLFEMIRSGVSGYVLKDVRPDELIKTIRRVVEGQAFIPPSLTPKVFQEFNRLSRNQEEPFNAFNLTVREIEVLQHVAQGLSNRDIAEKLFISEKTVKNHLTNIFQKMGVTDRTQALLLAIKHDIVKV
ncbi:response regulator [Thermosediminibacter litoriperuensis]|uniref:Stage 0 sporulation protein A homolog n=1 Tax=Thermosediminibacter litoriperuensis TaxID=291989 RepID=A0A5S5AQ57_9FIRM|nr:response regulator transcription factor [Thermosediminibacter litoriperuensis]TYP53779.1 LuxR family two component transcriptional regulator [Thermosediminibacter litoriperuensis]